MGDYRVNAGDYDSSAVVAVGDFRRRDEGVFRALRGFGGGGILSSECATLVVWLESVAQLVEHRPFKALVLGSSPSALTIKSITYRVNVKRLLPYCRGK